jgi:GT2 family glycosyltransferase
MPARAHVVLAAYEQLPLLRKSLRGYLRQTAPEFSLTVADDGSGPETAAFLEDVRKEAARRGIELRHVWQEDRGFRKARILNEAVRRAGSGDLFVFSDADCVPPARFVERHLAAHRPRSFHVGGVVRLDAAESGALSESDIDAGVHESLVTPARRRELRRRQRKSRWGMRLRLPNRPKVLGGNLALDRELLEALNGFDEAFEGWGYEDSDLRDRAMRLRPRPRVALLYGRNDVLHLWPEAPRRVGRERNRAYYRTRRPARCERGLRRGDDASPAPLSRGGS